MKPRSQKSFYFVGSTPETMRNDLLRVDLTLLLVSPRTSEQTSLWWGSAVREGLHQDSEVRFTDQLSPPVCLLTRLSAHVSVCLRVERLGCSGRMLSSCRESGLSPPVIRPGCCGVDPGLVPSSARWSWIICGRHALVFVALSLPLPLRFSPEPPDRFIRLLFLLRLRIIKHPVLLTLLDLWMGLWAAARSTPSTPPPPPVAPSPPSAPCVIARRDDVNTLGGDGRKNIRAVVTEAGTEVED